MRSPHPTLPRSATERGPCVTLAHERLAAAARYRGMARYMPDDATRAALIDTAAEFERMASTMDPSIPLLD